MRRPPTKDDLERARVAGRTWLDRIWDVSSEELHQAGVRNLAACYGVEVYFNGKPALIGEGVDGYRQFLTDFIIYDWEGKDEVKIIYTAQKTEVLNDLIEESERNPIEWDACKLITKSLKDNKRELPPALKRWKKLSKAGSQRPAIKKPTTQGRPKETLRDLKVIEIIKNIRRAGGKKMTLNNRHHGAFEILVELLNERGIKNGTTEYNFESIKKIWESDANIDTDMWDKIRADFKAKGEAELAKLGR